MTTCIVIADENDLIILNSMISNHFSRELQLLGTASGLMEGVNLIKQKSPQLIFFDTDLPDENGLSIYTYYPAAEFDVIFISSGPEYAIQAIKQMAIDYLMKPVSLIELKAALVRMEKRGRITKKKNDNLQIGIPFHEKIALPTSDGFQIMPFNEILYCQASENYSYIHTTSGESILISRTLKILEELLPSSCFFRIHKSVLLNINYVKSFSRKDGFIVTLETGQKFEIATRRHEEFVNQFIKKNTSAEVENYQEIKR